MSGMGWNRMEGWCIPFFQKRRPTLLSFLPSHQHSSQYVNRDLRHDTNTKNTKSQMQTLFFLLQSGLLHAQQGDRSDGDGVAWSAGAEGHRPLQLFTLLIELLRQARVLLRTHTKATYTSMYVGKTATATPWYNIAMECAAVATMMMLNLSAGTMYLSHLRCMATTM